MKCPKCGEKYHCPCKSCADRNKGKVVWIWKTGNGPIECGNCGLSLELHEFEDEDYRQMKEAGY